jgi:hypothetical protein
MPVDLVKSVYIGLDLRKFVGWKVNVAIIMCFGFHLESKERSTVVCIIISSITKIPSPL